MARISDFKLNILHLYFIIHIIPEKSVPISYFFLTKLTKCALLYLNKTFDYIQLKIFFLFFSFILLHQQSVI